MDMEDLKKKRAARKAKAAAAQAAQEDKDLEALDALETELGDANVGTLRVDRYVEGHPVTIVYKAPSKAQYKRFCDQVGKGAEKNNMQMRRDAQDLLAESVWIYPKDDADRKAMLEVFPGLLLSIAVEAPKLVEAKKAEEGKE